MSYAMWPHVRQKKSKPVQFDKNFAYAAVDQLLDYSTFAELRHYYIREFASKYAMHTWARERSVKAREQLPSASYLYGCIPRDDSMERLSELISGAVISTTDHRGEIGRRRQEAFKDAFASRFMELDADATLSPYDKVGAMMRAFLAVAKEQDSTLVHISHKHMRTWMRDQLGLLVNRYFKDNPNQPCWPRSPHAVMSELTATLNERSPSAPLPIAFPGQFAQGDRSATLRRKIPKYASYPKADGEFRDEASVRDTALRKLEHGEHLMMLPWMENGFQMNAFSWRNFDHFLQRFYIMTATEATFDKTFFCEWVAYGGAKWTKPEFKEQFDLLWDRAYTEWVELAKVIIPNKPDLAVTARMSSLPPKVRRDIAKATVLRWTGLVLCKGTMELLKSERAKDAWLDANLTDKEQAMSVREALGLLLTEDPSPSVKNTFDTKALPWPIHEHMAVLHAERVPGSSQVVSLPEIVMTDDFTKAPDSSQ